MATSRVDNIKPLDIKRLNVRNNHHTMETDKKVEEMRKLSSAILHTYDRDIEEMREKFGRLQTVRTPEPKSRRSPEPGKGLEPKPVKRPTSRASSLKVSGSKSQSKSTSDLSEPAPKNGVSITKSFKTSSLKVRTPNLTFTTEASNGASAKPGHTFPRGKTSTGGTVKKRSGSVKKKASESEANGLKKVSHSYCEKIVYDSETGETISDGGYILNPPRPRSTSMFDADSEITVPIIEDREMNRIMEAREGTSEGTGEGTRRGERNRSVTLDEALLQLGENCPYKDLIS